MNSSLSVLTDNLSELKHNACNTCNEEIKHYKQNNKILIYKYKQCNKKIYKSIDLLIKKFSNVYSICNNSISKFLSLLKKGIYPYEYMNNWNKFNETEFPTKK